MDETYGAILPSVYVTLFFWKFDPHPPPRNANNIIHDTFVTLFSRKSDTPPPHLHYVMSLEWPLFLLFIVMTFTHCILFSLALTLRSWKILNKMLVWVTEGLDVLLPVSLTQWLPSVSQPTATASDTTMASSLRSLKMAGR